MIREKKSILLYSIEFPPGPGGIGNHAYNLAKYLNLSGAKVTVIAHSRKEYLDDNNGQEDKFEIHRTFYYNSYFKTFKERLSTIFQVIKGNHYDAIILSGRFALFMLPLFRLKIPSAKIYYIAHAGDVITTKSYLSSIINLLLNKADKIIAVSNFTAKKLKPSIQRKTTVIPNGFELNLSAKDKVNRKSFLPKLLTIGTLYQRKGQHNVVRALNDIVNDYPDCEYHMIGAVLDDTFIKKELRERLEKHVSIHGVLSHEDKLHIMSDSDIFIMLSEETAEGDFEGFGIALIEANSMGLPTIGSLGCGIEDAISDGYNGLLVNAKDTRQIKESIKKILDNYNEYSRNAIAFSNLLTWDKVILKYMDVLGLNEKFIEH